MLFQALPASQNPLLHVRLFCRHLLPFELDYNKCHKSKTNCCKTITKRSRKDGSSGRGAVCALARRAGGNADRPPGLARRPGRPRLPARRRLHRWPMTRSRCRSAPTPCKINGAARRKRPTGAWPFSQSSRRYRRRRPSSPQPSWNPNIGHARQGRAGCKSRL